MRYHTTRSTSTLSTFHSVLFSGFAPDGGLYVPDCVPQLSNLTLTEWSRLSYTQLAHKIIPFFVPENEISLADLKNIIDRALSRIQHAHVVAMTRLTHGLNILELFHGPTLAFKDIAMSVTVEIMEYFTRKNHTHTTLIVGTSGDTGGSAIEMVRGRKTMDIVVFLPHKRCTYLQELQMTTVLDHNVHVFAVDGTNDEIQVPLTRCLKDVDFAVRHDLCSVNSINWVRVMVQIVHFFYAYFQVVETVGDVVEIVVPSGAAGNLAGGIVAYMMGLPIKLVACNNSNDLLARTISKGEYSQKKCQPTLAVSMDIQDVYNVERVLYFLSGYDVLATRDVMVHIDECHKATIPPQLLAKVQAVLSCHVVTDEAIEKTMRRCYDEKQYLICPHTATAVNYHFMKTDQLVEADMPRVCVATASAEKFPDTLRKCDLSPRGHPILDALPSRPTKSVYLSKTDDWSAVLREKIREISQRNVRESGF